MSFSVLVLTLNEEENIKRCLASVDWCDDVVVLDSYSADRTTQIAEAAGARSFQRRFDDFAGQRNFALDQIAFKYPWVFHLDADECFTGALREECLTRITEDQFSGFLVANKLMLDNAWLRYSGMYPVYQLRLLKVGEVRFVQKGHGQREGHSLRAIGKLEEPYLHYAFSKGIDDWYEKHRKYAAQEALEAASISEDGMDWAGLIAIKDRVRRRRALKALSLRLPFRGFLRFLYMYFLCLGFLDGYSGYKYCKMMAWYERQIAAHMRKSRVNGTVSPSEL